MDRGWTSSLPGLIVQMDNPSSWWWYVSYEDGWLWREKFGEMMDWNREEVEDRMGKWERCETDFECEVRIMGSTSHLPFVHVLIKIGVQTIWTVCFQKTGYSNDRWSCVGCTERFVHFVDQLIVYCIWAWMTGEITVRIIGSKHYCLRNYSNMYITFKNSSNRFRLLGFSWVSVVECGMFESTPSHHHIIIINKCQSWTLWSSSQDRTRRSLYWNVYQIITLLSETSTAHQLGLDSPKKQGSLRSLTTHITLGVWKGTSSWGRRCTSMHKIINFNLGHGEKRVIGCWNSILR